MPTVIGSYSMRIICGPTHDRRIFQFELPLIPEFKNNITMNLFYRNREINGNNNIGVLVSGGIDSALLYFLILEENITAGLRYNIIPYTILRIGASKPALAVLNWIHNYYKLPLTDLNVVGDPLLPEIDQVQSAIDRLLKNNVDFLYVGVMEDRPEHYVNSYDVKFKDSYRLRYPLLNLQKSHIIDLYIQKNITELIRLTSSCNVGEFRDIMPCGVCNGCQAKQWALGQMNFNLDNSVP